MRVLVAGATGAIGVPAVRALIAAGHDVAGTSRAASRAARLRETGARPVVMDALDADSVRRAVAGVMPDAIVQLLTALPARGPTRTKHLRETNRLRIEGTRNLIAAARDAGVARYVSESIVLGYGHTGDRVATEDDPFAQGDLGYEFAEPLRALASLEEQVRGSGGVVLRFGLYYGDNGLIRSLAKLARRRLLRLPPGGGPLPWIHLEDAASAVVAALERGAPGAVYNVAGDEPAGMWAFAEELTRSIGAPPPRPMPMWIARLAMPYVVAGLGMTLRVSTDKAKRDLGWSPRYPTIREGLGALVPQR